MEYDGYESISEPCSTIPATRGKLEKINLEQKSSKTKTRRGWGTKKNKEIKFSIIGNNSNGLKAKKYSLYAVLRKFDAPSCITIQETKLRFPGTFKIPGYQIYEKTRMGQGGGLLTAVDNSLSPMLISSGSNDEEILVIQAQIGNHKIRIINAYGPQEGEAKEKTYKFWEEIEKEVILARDENCFILIQMDANAKLGSGIIKKDPHQMSENGTLLNNFILRQNLSCLNAHKSCIGSITRHRKTINGEEKAILDYIIACEGLTNFLNTMIVDEKRENVLTKFATTKGIKMKSESDHNILFAQFNLTCQRRKPAGRTEIFDFKNSESLGHFTKVTANSKELRNCFDFTKPPQVITQKFIKTLGNIFQQSFKKIRIKESRYFPLSVRNKNDKNLLLKSDLQSIINNSKCENERSKAQYELEKVDSEIQEHISNRNANIVKEHVECIDTLDGKFNQIGMWNLKKKLCPRPKDPPTAKKDEFGNIISAPLALKNLYLKTYKTRLEHRKINEKYEAIRILKNELWDLRLESLKRKIPVPWTLEDLEKVTKSLKNNQARDPNGMISEIFKPKVAGLDLQKAILNLMNLVQSSLYIPEFMQVSDISSIYKNKGSRLELSSDRGIFTLGILRKILDKLAYYDKYPALEENMSDSNIGGRKQKNVRNHLFIVYGIISNVVREGRGCVDLQIYDLVQAFDALWLQDCMNDIYDCLPKNQRDRKLALVFESNVNNHVAINTPVGQTSRINLPQIVQQGGVWGPMQCSVSIDKIGRECTQKREHIYKYKDKISIITLAMIDDLLGIAPCGLESLALNTFINTQIEMKKLKFHTPGPEGRTKCHKIHVGKKNEFCPSLLVHNTVMPAVNSDTYLGDIICGDSTNKKNIANRVAKGHGRIAQIISIVEKISFGKHYFRIALLLRNTMFLSAILNNSEVWYRLTDVEISELETLDKTLLKRIFSVPNTTPSTALYLETGCMRIRTIIKARRANYLHYLTQLSEEEMLSKFFYCQWYEGAKDDWTTQVKSDLAELGLPSNLATIRSKSTFSWKNLVKKKAKEYELEKLLEIKETKNKSKMKELRYKKLEMQTYLSELEVKIAKNLFRYRVKMANFGGNFKGQGPTGSCKLCGNHSDLQELCFICPVVVQRIGIREKYENIFNNTITHTLARTLWNISELRNNEQDDLSQVPVVHHLVPVADGCCKPNLQPCNN